jgi:hypothetical protein
MFPVPALLERFARRRLVAIAVVVAAACGGHRSNTSEVRATDDMVRETDDMVREMDEMVRPPDETAAPEFRILPLNPSGFMWPLTTPPSVDPHYRVGFTWPLACGRRPVLPADVELYVDAWCRHLRDPRFDFEGELTRLLSSNVRGLRAAIVLDLANNGVEDLGRNLASGELALTRIAVEVALGHIEEATRVASGYVHTVYSDKTCGQDLHSWVFELEPRDIDWLPGLVRRHGTTACGKQFRRLACIVWSASRRPPYLIPECASVAFDDHDRTIIRGVWARLRWSPSLTADEYLEIAKFASSALVLYDAEGLAIRALQRTLKLSCKRLEEVREIAALIDGDHRKQERFAEARRELVSMTESECLEYRARRAGR